MHRHSRGSIDFVLDPLLRQAELQSHLGREDKYQENDRSNSEACEGILGRQNHKLFL
jgi:hypothetical protein